MIYDALIIGGGPAGATAAWFLARAGWSVALVEKATFPRRKVCGEFISATTLPLLHTLGLAETWHDLAGPPVHEVGLYAGKYTLTAPMPVTKTTGPNRGRALGREHLDDLLLNNARTAGVDILQPAHATGLAHQDGIFHCRMASSVQTPIPELQARVIIAAHGSWERGNLPTQAPKQKPAARDLFAFKAHFSQSELPPGLMPLLAFPGGYGGMVHSDHGRVSLSCCIRHDLLRHLRAHGHQAAGEIVLAHVMEHCDGVCRALAHAGRDGTWLSSGPIRPGIRTLHHDGIFAVGNTAGEAHPVVAEGISMAMQGAGLLAGILIARRTQVLGGDTATAGHVYEDAWRRHFTPRLRHAACFAHLAMRPAATRIVLPLFQRVPALLTLGASLSGKTTNTGGGQLQSLHLLKPGSVPE
jgi:flavin-dependent dehydrogenase